MPRLPTPQILPPVLFGGIIKALEPIELRTHEFIFLFLNHYNCNTRECEHTLSFQIPAIVSAAPLCLSFITVFLSRSTRSKQNCLYSHFIYANSDVCVMHSLCEQHFQGKVQQQPTTQTTMIHTMSGTNPLSHRPIGFYHGCCVMPTHPQTTGESVHCHVYNEASFEYFNVLSLQQHYGTHDRIRDLLILAFSKSSGANYT